MISRHRHPFLGDCPISPRSFTRFFPIRRKSEKREGNEKKTKEKEKRKVMEFKGGLKIILSREVVLRKNKMKKRKEKGKGTRRVLLYAYKSSFYCKIILV